MKRKIICCVLVLVLLSGCAPSVNERTVLAMDTVMNLSVYGDKELLDGAVNIITTLEDEFSVTKENSDICKINTYGSYNVSDDTLDILKQALDICDRTGGVLDISIFPVVSAWGFTNENYRIPEKEELDWLLSNVDYSNIQVDGSNVSIIDNMKIDLGSVAKGYTSNRIIQYWKDNGVESALINLGGNVHALGSKPDGSNWNIAIADPKNSESRIGIISISNKAVITSGGYERFFEKDGQTYWHIIDPSTGAPAKSGLISVTIVGENGLLCDALSTSLFVMGLDKATEFWRDSSDFEAIFVTEDGQIYVTEGLSDSFTVNSEYSNPDYTVIKKGG